MRRKLVLPVLLLLLVAGCATVTSGSPEVVRAEQGVNIAFEMVDTFLYVEKTHRADIEAAAGAGVHAVAERIRTIGPDAFRKARRLIDVYKDNRGEDAKADMLTALAFVQALASEVQPYLARYEAAKGDN